MFIQICDMFDIPPESVFNRPGAIGLLLGQDQASVLLKEVKFVNGHSVRQYLPDWMEDLSIFISKVSKDISIVGAVGAGDLSSEDNSLYLQLPQAKHSHGSFNFFLNASEDDCKLAEEVGCNYSVLRAVKPGLAMTSVKLLRETKNQEPDDGDSTGAQLPLQTPPASQWSSFQTSNSSDDSKPVQSPKVKPANNSLKN